MSGWDFATWRLASDDPVMRSTIIGLLVLDNAPDWDALTARFDRASRNVTVLRQKVIEGPLGYEAPRMVIDTDFDLSFHLRRFRMPARARWADVMEECRRQSMTDFDRDRPLWRITVLEGLPDGKAAVIVKLHHAIADGQGAVMLGAALFDFTEETPDLGEMPPEPTGQELDRTSFVDVMVRDNLGWVARTASDVISGLGPATMAAMRDPAGMAQRVINTAGSILRFTKIPLGPLSPLMTARSINYHFDTFDVAFADIRAEAKRNEATANDVFLSAIAEGLGEYHRRMGKPVDKLRVNMPISLRKPGGDGMDNAVSIARFELPVAHMSSPDIMKEVGELVRRWRAEPALALTDELAELSRVIPPELISAVAQASDLTASNVPGVPVPVWLAGARVLRMYPLVATIGAAVNVTMLTYNGTASVGVSTDDAAVDDREELIRCIRLGFRTVTGTSVAAGNPLTRRRSQSASSSTPGVDGANNPESSAVPDDAKKAPAKKASAKKAPVKKAPAKKAPAKKASAKKAPVKKAPAKKVSAANATSQNNT
jgi:diacylglycerol O-acyltransferase / wax synthase